jgi:hypothetical protein
MSFPYPKGALAMIVGSPLLIALIAREITNRVWVQFNTNYLEKLSLKLLINWYNTMEEQDVMIVGAGIAVWQQQ